MPDGVLNAGPVGRLRRSIYQHDQVSHWRLEGFARFVPHDILDHLILDRGHQQISAEAVTDDNHPLFIAVYRGGGC